MPTYTIQHCCLNVSATQNFYPRTLRAPSHPPMALSCSQHRHRHPCSSHSTRSMPPSPLLVAVQRLYEFQSRVSTSSVAKPAFLRPRIGECGRSVPTAANVLPRLKHLTLEGVHLDWPGRRCRGCWPNCRAQIAVLLRICSKSGLLVAIFVVC